jgi:hypothetical protein
MKASRQGSGDKTAQQTMGHGGEPADVPPAGPAKPTNDSWASWRSREDLAAKHPMGRGVIAAAAEAMKKPRR